VCVQIERREEGVSRTTQISFLFSFPSSSSSSYTQLARIYSLHSREEEIFVRMVSLEADVFKKELPIYRTKRRREEKMGREMKKRRGNEME